MTRSLWSTARDKIADIRAFANVQLLQGFLLRYQSELLKSPVNIIQVCREILSKRSTPTTRNRLGISLLSLGQIVQDPIDEDEGDEFVTMALDLLSTITAESVQREISTDEVAAYKCCLPHLDRIAKGSKDESRRAQAKNLISFIQARIEMASPSIEPVPESDLDIYRQALKYISDRLVPIRAQGVSMLRALILQNSAAILVDEVLDLLIQLLQDEDSYVYLNAIKAIQGLAEIHGERITRKIMNEYECRSDVDERLRLAEGVAGVIQRMGKLFHGAFARETIERSIKLVSNEKDWRVRVSAVGLISVCCEVAPLDGESAIEMALHLFKVNDLTFEEEVGGAAPLRRGAIAVIDGILRGGGIDALGRYTKDVIRSIKYLARADRDETVKELAQRVLEMLGTVTETEPVESRWNVGRKIMEL